MRRSACQTVESSIRPDERRLFPGEILLADKDPRRTRVAMPFWDALRGDPRFEKIVASLAPK